MELRLLQIVDNENITETEHSVELQGIGMLRDYFVNEVSCNINFEFVQALIRLFLKIHGETIRCKGVARGSGTQRQHPGMLSAQNRATAHYGAVTRLQMTNDGFHLFSAGTDSRLIIF